MYLQSLSMIQISFSLVICFKKGSVFDDTVNLRISGENNDSYLFNHLKKNKAWSDYSYHVTKRDAVSRAVTVELVSIVT